MSGPSAVLRSLTAAALALPSLQSAAGVREETSTASLRLSRYSESDLPLDRVANPTGERYDIKVAQLRIGQPVLDSWRLTADVQYETMSGASPWYVQRDAGGRPVQVMSQATIHDQRTDVGMDLRWYSPEVELGVRAGYSQEDDYAARSVGLDSLVAIGSTTSLNAGIGFTDDRLEPTQSTNHPASVIEADKHAVDAVLGITQILSPRAVLQLAVSAARHSGFLSDPYKRASVDDVAVPDSRPDERANVAITTRLRYRLVGAQASVHAGYRFYRDDWKVESHTVDLAWYQELGSWWVAPSIRWYSQGQAFFYRPFYVAPREDGLYSSDYRLSPYGAIAYGLLLRTQLGAHAVSLSLEHYDSSASFAIEDVDLEHPALVDFTIGTLGVDFAL